MAIPSETAKAASGAQDTEELKCGLVFFLICFVACCSVAGAGEIVWGVLVWPPLGGNHLWISSWSLWTLCLGQTGGTGPRDDCSVVRQLFLGLFCRGEDY